jgi:hypothetical protein
LRWPAALAATVALSSGVASATEVEANLEVVGRSDLGGGGRFGAVAVVGTTVIVAVDPPETGPSCARATVKVVDVEDPKRPKVVADLELPAGSSAADIAATSVTTDAYTGDLVAIALRSHTGAQGVCTVPRDDDVVYFDVTDPAGPRTLGRSRGCPGCPRGSDAVSLAQRGDGRVVSARAAAGTVVVDALATPAAPAPLGRWTAPAAGDSDTCRGVPWVRDVELRDDGHGALVVLDDGRVHDLDLSDPATPGGAEGAGPVAAEPATSAASFAAVLPIGARTLAVVSEDLSHDSCAGAPADRGLRVFELDGGTPVEREPVRFPGEGRPGRLVASGELAYVAWHERGVRVLDMGQVRPRAVAQFIPADPAVVGVGLLANHVVVTDTNSGLYVLERPDEAGSRSSFWSDLVGLLPYLGFAGLLVAAIVIPELALGRAPGRSHVPSPVPEPTRTPRRST